MSEFKFLCPECGQKLSGDAAYSGLQIACPTCHKTITVPHVAAGTAASVSGSAPPPIPMPRTQSRPASMPLAATASRSQAAGPVSGLAGASLICSVFVPFGSIPGIICGHLAQAQMRRNIFLRGKKMAGAGLLISYCVLLGTLALAGVFLFQHLHFKPLKVMRESPAAVAAMQPRIVDAITVGENEDDHDMDGQLTSMASNGGKRFRSAMHGGSFSYSMKVLPNEAMTLNCNYWGGENEDHEFDIAVDNQIIATQNLVDLAPGHFVDMEYKIPAALTRGKTEVKVEFLAHPDMTAGALYGCQMLKR